MERKLVGRRPPQHASDWPRDRQKAPSSESEPAPEETGAQTRKRDEERWRTLCDGRFHDPDVIRGETHAQTARAHASRRTTSAAAAWTGYAADQRAARPTRSRTYRSAARRPRPEARSGP